MEKSYIDENYIEFIESGNNIKSAIINFNGIKKSVRANDNYNKLLEICNKYGVVVNGPGVLDAINIPRTEFDERSMLITNICTEYYQYLQEKNSSFKKLAETRKIIKSISATAAAGLIAVTGAATINKSNNKNIIETDAVIPMENQIEEQDEKITTEQLTNYSYETNTFQTVGNKETQTQPTTEKNTETETKNEQTTQTQPTQSIYDQLGYNNDEFHYSYDSNQIDPSCMKNAQRYEDIFEYYAEMYGLDKNLLMSIAAQESGGDHYGNIYTDGAAEGIMQIEKNVHIGTTTYAYNFQEQRVEGFDITEENLRDINTNIKVGAMILRSCIEHKDYNIPLALQEYNFGPGNMDSVLGDYCGTNEEFKSIINNPGNNTWLTHRAFLSTGDPEYVEHVFSHLGNEAQITIQKRPKENINEYQNNQATIKVINDQQTYNYAPTY